MSKSLHPQLPLNPVASTPGLASALLSTGERLETVVAVAASCGITISAKTALRWALSGRNGRRLPSIKVGGRRLTTRSQFVQWLDETQEDALPVRGVTMSPADADKVLASFGLSRKP